MVKNIDEIPEGGWGLKFMLRIANRLSYTRTPEHKNCLSIVKNYEQPGFDESQTPPKNGVLEQLIEFFSRLNWFKDKHQPQVRCDTPIQKINLQVNTDLQELERVLEWFNQLEHLPISQQVWAQCQLVLAEGFTNAVRHAHKNLPWETPIELEVIVFSQSLEIKIWDYGQPFDLETKLSTLENSEQDLLAEGGRGLIFMKKLAACVSYTRTSEERNCLVIVKHLPNSLLEN
jgi:serine/threonine-protein kinase RsbW